MAKPILKKKVIAEPDVETGLADDAAEVVPAATVYHDPQPIVSESVSHPKFDKFKTPQKDEQ